MDLSERFVEYEGFTFDDVLLEPSYSEVIPSQVCVKSFFTSQIGLNIPICSAAMDTVTDGRLAIAIAREGGIGVIHRNMTPDAQAEEVDKVKRSESGVIVDPFICTWRYLRDAVALMEHYHISGVPIVDAEMKLVGIITNRDSLYYRLRSVHKGRDDQGKFNSVTYRDHAGRCQGYLNEA